MNKLKLRLMEALREAGVTLEEGGAWKLGGMVSEEQAYLSLARIRAAQAGAFGYLGMDQEQREIYGMELTVEMRLSLLSPKAGGIPGAERYGEMMLGGLLGCAGQLYLEEISCQSPEYDGTRDCYRQEILVKTRALAQGIREEEQFLVEDFRLRFSRS